MDLLKLNRSIFAGLEQACRQSVRFNDFLYPDIKPEYLITVNVAQQIYTDDDFVIKLEDDTDNFKDGINIKGDLMAYFEFMDSFVIKRPGRIDIGLYSKDHKPICPIEIKGFNIASNEILKDLGRNINFLSTPTGINDINCAIVAFLSEHKHCYAKTQKKAGLDKIKTQYVNLINHNFDQYSELKFEVFTETAHESLWDSLDEIEAYAEEDIADELSEKAHYVGVIINISRIYSHNDAALSDLK